LDSERFLLGNKDLDPDPALDPEELLGLLFRKSARKERLTLLVSDILTLPIATRLSDLPEENDPPSELMSPPVKRFRSPPAERVDPDSASARTATRLSDDR
jgi:hypothetical protein